MHQVRGYSWLGVSETRLIILFFEFLTLFKNGWFVGGFMYGVCFVTIVSSHYIRLVTREGRAS